MRLLVWSQYFWPEYFLINKLTTTLSARDVEVTVITGKPNYPDGKLFLGYRVWGIQREDFSGVEIIRLPMLPRGNSSPKALLMNYLSFIVSGYLLAPVILRGKKYDAIFVYAPSPLLKTLPAILVSRLKNIPLILWVQDTWPEALKATGFIKNEWLLRPVEAAVRYIYRSSDCILIQSEAFRPSVQRHGGHSESIHYFPNFAEDIVELASVGDYESAVAEDLRKQFSVVFTGNIGSAQSCETIVSAAELLREHNEIRFYLIGTGSSAQAIGLDIKKRSLNNIVMTGKLPAEEMPSIFSAASVLLVSLRDQRSLAATIPSKLQNYMSAGKPIVASLNGEAARIVEDSNSGISCPAEDAKALANSVLQLYGMSPVARSQLGANARRYFEDHFKVEDRVKELIGHLQRCIE